MILWKEEYAVGIPMIDQQHQELFNIANKIYALLKNDLVSDKYDHIAILIKELQEYTVYHFTAEENYMQSIEYKKFFSQKVAHTEFIKKLTDINWNQIDQDQDQYLLDVLNFIVDWLTHHILKADKLIASQEK